MLVHNWLTGRYPADELKSKDFKALRAHLIISNLMVKAWIDVAAVAWLKNRVTDQSFVPKDADKAVFSQTTIDAVVELIQAYRHSEPAGLTVDDFAHLILLDIVAFSSVDPSIHLQKVALMKAIEKRNRRVLYTAVFESVFPITVLA